MRILMVTIASFAAATALVVSGCGGSEAAGTAKSGDTAASGATLPNRITVEMGEWFFRTDQPRVTAGKVTVTAHNAGKIEHELIALKTDLPADRMPMAHDGDELDLEKSGEIMIGETHEHGDDEHMDDETAGEHMDGADEHMDDETAGEHMDGAEDEGSGMEDEADEHAAEEGHLEAGETRRYTVNLKSGNYVLLCSIPGHYQSGQYVGLVAVQ
jgi:uncharacterized cupredoxin-like copper-binding protein